MGVLMSGLLNGGQKVGCVMINGTNFNINVENVLEYMNENPGTDVMDAIAVLEPGLFDFLRGNQPQRLATINQQTVTNAIASMAGNNHSRIPNTIGQLLTQQFNKMQLD